MRDIKNICVFCGSSPGADIAFTEAARALGRIMAQRNIGLVYGGSNIGLMRAIADEVLRGNGRVVGVMPQGLIDKEVAYTTLKEFHVVDTMSRRKELMADLSDAFIAMPGGIGTLDELFEAMSWNQLDIMDKPVALLNTAGFYDHLIAFLKNTVDKHFVRPEHFNNLIVEPDAAAIITRLTEYNPVKVDSKWIDDLRVKTSRLGISD
ncbi:MAG TPA: TIGR00730 family Rossman fold protein [Lentimicrobium sp.]|nr:TIGR00730 family Rossman fold protein [Lentimicrobium sp.]